MIAWAWAWAFAASNLSAHDKQILGALIIGSGWLFGVLGFTVENLRARVSRLESDLREVQQREAVK